LRAEASVILTAIGTVLADDPRLDVRVPLPALAGRRPLRAVIDGELQMPATASMLRLPGRTVIFTRADSVERRAELEAMEDVTLVGVPASAGSIPRYALEYLAEREQANEVLVEAGSRLCGSLVAAGLVDELVLYVAPALLGERAAPLLHLPAVSALEDRIPLHVTDLRSIRPDLRITATPMPVEPRTDGAAGPPPPATGAGDGLHRST